MTQRPVIAVLKACAAFLCVLPLLVDADQLHIAVASNFKPALEQLVGVFEAQTGHEVSVSYGSTGRHYAQIINGAPFEVFLAADTDRPQRLEEAYLALPGSRFTYAIGKLVLWAPGMDVAADAEKILHEGNFRFLAIANPRGAPYGRAAEQFLTNLGVWEGLQSRLVRGENIAQAFAYVKSGNAQIGLLAMSQMVESLNIQERSLWMVPQDLYQPIEQQAVLLKDSSAANAFMAFLGGEQAKIIIPEFGYTLP